MLRRMILMAVIMISCSGSVMATGIPVVDVANLAQAQQQLVQMIQQLNSLKQQYNQLQRTYQATTGSRNLGDTLNNQELRSYLPADWQNVYDGIKSGGYQGLTGNARNLRNAEKVYDTCASITDNAARIACERQTAQAYQDKAWGLDAYAKTNARLQQIQGLMQRTNATNDQKGALEIIARLQAENALIENERTRLQLYSQLAAAEEKLAEQQKKELAIQEMKKYGLPKLEPIQWDRR